MNYFDLHCDTLIKLNKNFTDLAVFQNNLFENYCQVFSVFIEDSDKTPFKTYKSLIKTAKKYNINGILSLENATLLQTNLYRIRRLKKDGIKSVMLTWNGKNKLAGGALSSGELTKKGRKAVKMLNKYNIAVDLSHLNEKSFYSVLSHAKRVLASHSNCKSILDNPRNLTDDQIKAIINKKGVIGLNFYPAFLGDDVFLKIYENIIHIISLGGENAVSLGSDFDGAEMAPELDSIIKVKTLYNYLLKKGIEKKQLDKVFYLNAFNFYNSFDK